MTGALPLAGKVVAIVGTGSDADRAIAVACAEAGADLALATESSERDQDYGMNSIANEIWAIGREHFVRVLDGAAGVEDLVAEARERFGRCDAIVARDGFASGLDLPIVSKSGEPSEVARAVLAAAIG